MENLKSHSAHTFKTVFPFQKDEGMNGVTKIQLICRINGKADSDVGLLLLRTLPYKHGCLT